MLKNKLGLRDQTELDAFEALSVAVRAEEPRLEPTRFLKAMISSFFGDERPLSRQLRALVLG